MQQGTNKHHLLIFVLSIFALVAILFSAGNFKLNEEVRFEVEGAKKLQATLANIPVLAKAVSVYDVTENRKIYGKEDAISLPFASLVKTMTVIVALNQRGLNDIIITSPNSVSQAGDFGLFAYEKWRVGDLAKFTLLSSANDGAYAFSEGDETFVEKMNAKARRIGMAKTFFLSATGLDFDLEHPSAFASAEDANTMAIYAHRAYPEIFSATTLPDINLKSESGFVHSFKNTNIIIEKIPNLLFSKTGYTVLAGGNLTIIFKNKNEHEIAVTVLGSTFEGRFTDMENIVNLLYSL